MSDDGKRDALDALGAALNDARSNRRQAGVDAAMAAFDRAYPPDDEKPTTAAQGSADPARLTERQWPAPRARTRRKTMSGSGLRKWAIGGGLSLAATAAIAVVVLSQVDFLQIEQRAWREDGVGGGGGVLGTFSQGPSSTTVSSVGGDYGATEFAPTPSPAPSTDRARDEFLAAARDSARDQAIALHTTRSAETAELQEQYEAQRQLLDRGLIARSEATRAGRELARRKAEIANTQIANIAPPQPSPSAPAMGALTLSSGGLQPRKQAPPPETPSRDRFPEAERNDVKSVSQDPVSTFSIDVDTAAYAYVRSALNAGAPPPPAAVRIEEMINYFPYDYEGPDDPETPFRAHVSVTETPWNADTKLMHIGIKGYAPPPAERAAANLVFLVDVSGSMNEPNKLPLLVNSLRLMLSQLDDEDRVAIVTYAGAAGVALAPTRATERATIVAALEGLRAGGGTAGAQGLALAYQTARENFDPDAVNRVILATDGDFNVGFSSPEEMKAFVERERDGGVLLSVLGFGRGNYNDALMQALAQNGNGTAAYIDTLSEARKVLVEEIGAALTPIASDVKLQVEFNPAVISEYRLIGYETRALRRQDFNDDTVDAGDIGAGHTATAIYELTPTGSPAELLDDLRYSQNAELGSPAPTPAAATAEIAFLKMRYKRPGDDESILITRPIDAADEIGSIEDAGQETRFATAVAAFGELLRGGRRLGDYGYDEVIALASGARGDDPFGYRAEFLTIARLAQSLSP